MIFPNKCQNYVINLPCFRLSSQIFLAYPFYKVARVFDPRQLPTLDLSIEKFTAIKAL